MYNPDEKKDNIDRVKDSLYSKNTDAIFVKRRHSLQNKAGSNTPTVWNVKEEKAESSFQLPYTKIFLGSLIFFILALGFTFSKFFLGNNVVSGNNIDILVSGPVSIAGGEELLLEIQVKNNNNIDLKVVDLRIEYPAGTKSVADQSIDMPRYSEILGNINIGKSEKRLIRLVLYGEENSQKIIKITAEYRVLGSNAIFSKEKDFNVLISSSPVNIKVTGPTEINANQLTDFSIDINSNSTNIVKNLILKVDYPFGFNLSSSNPKSVSPDGSVFAIGDLAPGAKRNIRISGTVAGQDGEQRVLKFTVGTPSKDDDTVVGTPLALYVSTVSLKKSSVGLDVAINDESGKETNINVGSKNRVSIFWKNNLTEKIYDMVVKVKFSGLTLDKESISAEKGFYNSSDNSIIFDKSSDSLLSMINPSDEGSMRFNFNTLFPSSKSAISFGNSAIKLDISVLGNRAGLDGSAQEILYSDSKTLKISSALKLLSRGFRTVGPFENSGPFPPEVDSETTYTITWTATDSFNNVTLAKVSAFLPPNVKWTSYTSPDSEKITYDKGTGEVVWNIGDMKFGIGTNSPARSVSFQVAITPSITQLGSEINLLNEATISGTDAYSQARIGEVKSPVTTNITSDPEYVDDIGKVVKQAESI
ncbi:MAG: hypothetical protein ABIF22_02345 [bacterium]